ncbi:hypothetical protein IWZ00DRAFT_328626 [Phyllosticta capitalensis]
MCRRGIWLARMMVVWRCGSLVLASRPAGWLAGCLFFCLDTCLFLDLGVDRKCSTYPTHTAAAACEVFLVSSSFLDK